jgi:hypothetical protein
VSWAIFSQAHPVTLCPIQRCHPHRQAAAETKNRFAAIKKNPIALVSLLFQLPSWSA